MSNPWFRMYHEFATDPKVQMLSEADQRRYIMLLCLRCSNDGETLHDEEIAFQLRIPEEEYQETKARLMAKSLVGEDNQPINWDKRQFVSDSSTERVRAYRERRKEEVKQKGNVTETPPDTESDTDTDTESDTDKHSIDAEGARKKKTYSDEFESAWGFYPKREGSDPKNKAYSAWKARLAEGVSADLMTEGVKRYAAFCAAKGNIGTGFVMQGQRFFGPGKEYENDWAIAPAPSDEKPTFLNDDFYRKVGARE